MRFLVYFLYALVAVEAHKLHKHKRVYIEDAPPPPPPPDFGKFLQHFLRIDVPFVSVRTGGNGYHKGVSVDAPFVSVRTSGVSRERDHDHHHHRTKTYHKTVSVDAPFVSVRTSGSLPPPPPPPKGDFPFPPPPPKADLPPKHIPLNNVNDDSKRNSVDNDNPAHKSVSVDAPFVSVRTSGEAPNVKDDSPHTNSVKGQEKNVHVQAPFVTVDSQKSGVKVEAPFTSVSNGHVNVDLSPIFGSGFNLVDVMAPFTNVKVSG
ncbi:hypothetical protein ACFFRR_002546 [Megaselia abdita]